ncbi:hypothetical protein [Halobaculum rubrum]|uniref:hypothetical protein n=1 Tax=Halobaculum rubrum TaxID=2872158 RepID=UPI003CE4C9D6
MSHPAVVNVAWVPGATIVGLPVRLTLIDLVPTVLSLKEPRSPSAPDRSSGQRSPAVRGLYFVLVAWRLTPLWAVSPCPSR